MELQLSTQSSPKKKILSILTKESSKLDIKHLQQCVISHESVQIPCSFHFKSKIEESSHIMQIILSISYLAAPRPVLGH